MSKAFLVALREYMENLKTKAFWIGIMAFPVILVLAFAVPVLLEKKKDVRYYAVLDHSGWLLKAVEERSTLPDMEKVLEEAFDKYERGGKAFEEFPEALRLSVIYMMSLVDQQVGKEPADPSAPEHAEWKARRGEVLDDLIEQGAAMISMMAGPEGMKNLALVGQLSKEQLTQIQEEFEKNVVRPIQEWWSKLPPKEAERYGSRLSKSRYARKEVDLSGPDPEARLKAMLNQEKIFAYFVIGQDPVGEPPDLSEDPAGEVEPLDKDLRKNEGPASVSKYVSNNLTDTELQDWFSRYANAAISEQRLDKAKIAKETANWLKAPLVFESKKVTEAGEEEVVATEDKIRQWAPVVFVYLLWISIFTITQMLLTNTIEEKSNKIMEVLLSSVSPIQLMAGKIIGIAGTGLTMVVSWVIFFLAGIKFLPLVLGDMPKIDFAMFIRDPTFLISFVVYFILGYLLLSAILVGLGSVCNSLKEAQNLMAPVTIIMIVPLLAMVPIGQDPNGTIARVMSYIPPFTPFVMMNRAAGPPAPMEYVVTSILLVVSIAFTLWAAAKVFRVGILMTGKPPKLGEILKWVRAPVGQVQAGRE